MTDTPEYLPFDQDRRLGPPPWSPEDPAVKAWEAGHGHDVRLKCYVEFGCQAIENALDAALADNQQLREALGDALVELEGGKHWDAIAILERAALSRPDTPGEQ